LTVTQNLAYGIQRQPDGPAQVEAMLARLRLAGLAHRYPHQLSGGQQQRVALGRALMIKPTLLLLDEPFAALDQGMRENLQTDLVDLQRELGLAIIYITHNLMDAFAIGDCLAVMQAGRLEQVGPIRQVFYRPNSRTVAEIIGVRNLLEGVVQSTSSEGLVINWEGYPLLASRTSHSPGEQITFYIRPEDVKILYPNRPLASTVQHNRFTGRVLYTISGGASVTVRLGVEDKPIELESRLPLRVYQSLELEVGSTLTFSLRHDCIMLLPRNRL
jgi:molybdate transport system ATP-binding protein